MQSWNWPAIKKCAKLIRKPDLLIPKLSFSRVSDIDWVRLRNDHGIRGICFDKDNTITAPYSPNIHLSVSESVQKCKEIFNGQVVVFSNSIGSLQFDPKFEKATSFTKATGLDVIKHNSKKPEGSEHISNHFQNMQQYQIAFIGDRVLTDVVMSNEAGFLSVLVRDPLTVGGDNVVAIFVRWLEKIILNLLNRKK